MALDYTEQEVANRVFDGSQLYFATPNTALDSEHLYSLQEVFNLAFDDALNTLRVE